jgi:integrase
MAKLKNKMCYARKDKDGNIVSYRFHYSGLNPLTGQHKQYTATWKVPKGLSQKEIEHERKKAEFEFIVRAKKESDGTAIKENNITFEEYAKQWHERILLRNKESYAYYVRVTETLKILNRFFGNCLLKNISPIMVQKFCDWLCERTHTKEIITVKKSIFDLITEQGLTKCKLAEECGLDRLTLRLASKVGQQVSMTTAKAVTKRFDIPLSKYFNIEKQEVRYSKATNASIRTILVVILGEAKRQRLIEHNFASKEFIRPLTGIERQKEIFNEDEAREFVKAALKEPHPKKKVVFSLLIFLGLRKAEVCGLTWCDIDFENRTLSVNHNSLYFPKFGIVTKEPKTKRSKRTITLPEQLVTTLAEYKTWYDEQKINYGDLWADTNNLFLQDNGQIINPCTVNLWLRKFNTAHGFKHIPPHALRHTCITMQLDAGVPIKVVSTRAGHASERITLDIYTHALQSQDEKAADTYNKYLMGQAQ